MKRKGSLLIASTDRRSFTLRFYPDREEGLGPETLVDLEVPTVEALGEALAAMGFSGVSGFLEHLGSPPEVLEFVELQLSKQELRRFGLLGADPLASRPAAPPPRRRDEREETGH